MAEKPKSQENSSGAADGYMDKRKRRARGWLRSAGGLFVLSAATFVSAFVFPPMTPLLVSSYALAGLGTGSALIGAANAA